MQASNGLISIKNPYNLPDFPSHLNPNETEAFTCDTFRELFAKAQSQPVPAYAIAIIQLPKLSPDSPMRYKIYDGLAFRNYQIKCEETRRPLRDLQTQEPIQTNAIRYFAVNCFERIGGEIKKVGLQGQTFKRLFPDSRAECPRIERILRQIWRTDRHYLHTIDKEEMDYQIAQRQQIEDLYPSSQPAKPTIEAKVKIICDCILSGVQPHTKDHETLSQIQLFVALQWRELFIESKAAIWKWCSEQNKARAVEDIAKN